MKLLIFNYEYPPLGGGGGVATKQLMEVLAARHEIHVITTHYKGLAREEEIGGIHIHRVPVIGRKRLPTATIVSMLTFVPAAFWKGLILCQKHRFDVINAQFVIPSGVPACLLAKIYRIPFVVSLIGGDIFDPSKGISPHRHWLLRAAVRFVVNQSVECTAISEDTKRRARIMHNVTKPITVTPLGLVRTAVPPATRSELQIPEHVPVFVSIGRLINRKGYDNLIVAWREIYTAHLVIIGSGPLHDRLKGLCEKYQLTDRVHLLGFVEETKKQQILRVSDVYISAADHEGFGIVFLEAMEAGLPIIATDKGGQTDFLSAGENAILIPPNEIHQITSAIAWMLKDSRLRETMAANNKQKVSAYYIEKTAAVFEHVLQRAHEHND